MSLGRAGEPDSEMLNGNAWSRESFVMNWTMLAESATLHGTSRKVFGTLEREASTKRRAGNSNVE